MNDIVKFIFELGMLRNVNRSGWSLLGVKNPENVAEHSLRAAQIGFILSKLEKYENPEEVVTILVFHDVVESRVGDVNKVSNRYVKSDEEQAVKDQIGNLEFNEDLMKNWTEFEERKTKAGIIAKDADWLEAAFTAKEYMEKGYNLAEDWINNVSKSLKTNSAKKLLNEMKKSHSTDWWQGLKKIN